MKKTLFLLLMALPLLFSCEKFGSNALVGDWLPDDYELYCDGQLIVTNPKQIDLVYPGHIDILPVLKYSITFADDGYVWVLGSAVGTYSYSNGVVKIQSVGGNKDSDPEIVLKNGVLTTKEFYSFDSPAEVTIYGGVINAPDLVSAPSGNSTARELNAKKIEMVQYYHKKN